MKTKRIPKKADKRRAWIKYQLDLRGESFASIARELGVTRQAVLRAMVLPRPRMEQAIAAKLGLRPWDVWPERYPECVSECAHHSE